MENTNTFEQLQQQTKPRKPRNRTLQNLRRAGFDLSYRSAGGGYRVRCSQCEALVINGVACHERGCCNASH